MKSLCSFVYFETANLLDKLDNKYDGWTANETGPCQINIFSFLCAL